MNRNLVDQATKYLEAGRILEVRADAPITAVHASVEVSPGQYLAIGRIPERLPQLPDRQQEFAFQCAMGKSIAEIAKSLNLARSAAYRWLEDPVVRAYIACVKWERRLFHQANLLRLERKVFAVLNEHLSLPPTSSTFLRTREEAVRQVVQLMDLSRLTGEKTPAGESVATRTPEEVLHRLRHVRLIDEALKQDAADGD